MKTLTVLLSTALLLPAAAFADEPAPARTEARTPVAVTCVQDTGSRIKRKSTDDCRSVAGRSYDREALDQTGAINAGDALRNLDPGVTIRR